MMEAEKKSHSSKSKGDVTFNKDDDLTPKGKIVHEVQTDWPTKETTHGPHKKRKIKRIETSRLP